MLNKIRDHFAPNPFKKIKRFEIKLFKLDFY